MQDVQPPPIRTLDDFLLGSARFSLPDVRNLERWNNRIINNLLYYQTNYFVSALGVLVIPGVFRFYQLVVVSSVVLLLFVGFVWAAENHALLRRFRRNHPSFCLLAILLACYVVLSLLGSVSSLLGSVSIFLFGIVLPILLVVIHASLRLRNLKNKVENKLESIGLKRTPMGLMLEALGQEQEAGS